MKIFLTNLRRARSVLVAAVVLVCAFMAPLSAGAVAIRTEEAEYEVHGGIRGVDVSENQDRIAWGRVAEDNVEFAIIRASYGTMEDACYRKNMQGAAQAGLKVGVYHDAYFKDRETMRAEAALFLSLLADESPTYPVFVDVEVQSLPMEELTELAAEFLDILRAKGYTAMLYSHDGFFGKYLDWPRFQEGGLWVANYREEPGFGQVIWQHTIAGEVDGIHGNVGIDIAYEDLTVKKK